MILRLRAVEGLTGISRATIYRMVKAGTFPQQVQISPGAVGWHAEEIDAWVASRPTAGTQAGTHGENRAVEPAMTATATYPKCAWRCIGGPIIWTGWWAGMWRGMWWRFGEGASN